MVRYSIAVLEGRLEPSRRLAQCANDWASGSASFVSSSTGDMEMDYSHGVADMASSESVAWLSDLQGALVEFEPVVMVAIALASAFIAGASAWIARKMTVKGLNYERDRSLLNWSNEVLATMAGAIGLSYCDPSPMDGRFFDERRQLLARLSTLIDQGRLHFKNEVGDGYQDRELGEEAFDGIRPDILTTIVCAYDQTGQLKLGYNSDASRNATTKAVRRALVGCKRRFVSCVQSELRTKWQKEPKKGKRRSRTQAGPTTSP